MPVSESHRQMLAALQRAASDENTYLEQRTLQTAKRELASLGPTADPAKIWATKYKIGLAEFKVGHEEEAIRCFEELVDSLDKTELGKNPANRAKLAFQLGVAYLRLAETQNCCQRYTPDSCVFPIRGGGIHQQQDASRTAVRYFTETVRTTPLESNVHLSARWLLNLAYMTLGAYPDQVPPEFLIPLRSFESKIEFPKFQNISIKVGLDTLSLAGGAVVEDFDQDGNLDLLVSTWEPTGQIQFFHNNGDGSFANRTQQAGLLGIVGGLNLLQADFDNDGNVDVLVLRGGWLGKGGRHPNSLLRNLGNGSFDDVTFAVGLATENYPTQTASWGDYDNDGFIDLYVGNETTKSLSAPCQLFHNNADGTFTDVALAAGVTNDRFTKAVVWGDYDADNLPDLYVSNHGQPNRLYRNNGNGTFTDVGPQLGVERPLASFASWFWDFDNDGDLDLFVTPYMADISDIASSAMGLNIRRLELPGLYRNDGGKFTDVGRQMNLNRPDAPMGANFGDLDNDGFLDFYLGTGWPFYRSLMPNAMYLSRAGTRFEDVTVAGGFGSLQKGHAVVFADLDNDGDQDIFEQMGGVLAGDRFVDALYENPGFGNKWIGLQLVGTKSNRSAIGARIHLQIREDGKTRDVFKYVNSGATFGANPLRQTIGLGRADEITSLEVHWPTSNTTQVFREVRLNEMYRIEEGARQPEAFSLRAFRLGG